MLTPSTSITINQSGLDRERIIKYTLQRYYLRWMLHFHPIVDCPDLLCCSDESAEKELSTNSLAKQITSCFNYEVFLNARSGILNM